MSDQGDHPWIDEDGVRWEGTREELEAWKVYKQCKAHAFVDRGYSVEWYRDADNTMCVYLAERWYARTPELRASVKFFGKPSQFGIDGGMVSKLTIYERRTDIAAKVLDRPYEQVRTLFNLDRGLDMDELASSPEAGQLYQVILAELN